MIDWQEIFSTIILPIIGTALTAIVGYVGIRLKSVYERMEGDKTKKNIAKMCVEAVEQLYTDLHGAEKYYKAVEAMSQMLEERGIACTDLEVQMLIESAVRQMNEKKTETDLQECSDCDIVYGDEGK